MTPPTFFLSSTIHDFRDLRTALKYFLEQQGCVVLASEFNDFPKALDSHSYEACLTTIAKADYFVLLIGTRVGGWFDEANRISITQREYREAYRLHAGGRLKLINFVRSDVWTLREDRKELAALLSTLELSDELKKRIANYPTKRAADAEFIASFIAEVGRNRETSAAVSAGGSLPSGNWVHVFESFRDIVDVISTQAFRSAPIEQETMRRLLSRELREILRTSLVKINGQLYSPRVSVERFHGEHNLDLASRDLHRIELDAKRWDLLASLSMHLFSVSYTTLILERSLESPTFLEFDSNIGTFRETVVYHALHSLYDEIRTFRSVALAEVLSVVSEHSPRARGSKAAPVAIEPMKLFSFLHLVDRWVNICELARALVLHLEGKPFSKPSLRPRSPVRGMMEQIQKEIGTDKELDAFLAADR